MSYQTEIDKELDGIRKRNGGMISPDRVVDFAKNPKTALHARFNWDNTEAAHQYRLWQARQLIRVRMIYLPQSDKPVRAFVSLSNERGGKGGYRPMELVLRSRPMREQMLSDALADFEILRRKYATLKALAPVFAALDSVVAKGKGKAEGVMASV